MPTHVLTVEKLDISPIQEEGMDEFKITYRKNGKTVFIPKERSFRENEKSGSLLIIGIMTVLILIFIGYSVWSAGYMIKEKGWFMVSALIAGGIFTACSILDAILKSIVKQIAYRL